MNFIKKYFSILVLVITVVLSTVVCYADNDVTNTLDPFSLEVVDSDDKDNITRSKISLNWYYDVQSEKFIYEIDGNNNQSVYSSVYDGDFTNDSVEINSETVTLALYKNGELFEEGNTFSVEESGSYVLRYEEGDSTLFNFNVIGEVSTELGRLQIPAAYSLVSAKCDGESIVGTSRQNLDIIEEGSYVIVLRNKYNRNQRTVEFTVDNTAPELIIEGLKDNEARNAVHIGELEADSTLQVLIDGIESYYDEDEGLTKAGDYTLVYTDKAGNSSYYEFVIHTYLDLEAWVAVALIAAIFIAAAVYMIYKKTHLRIS